MKAVRLIGLTACLGALAACSDLPTTTRQDTDRARLDMAQDAWDEAVRLDSLADNAAAAGKQYRALLLRAIIDALQFGVPITPANVTIGGTSRSMRVVQMNAIVKDSVTQTDSTGAVFAFAWSGIDTAAANKVDTVIVVGRPYDPNDMDIWGPTQAFFLDATVDDTPWLLTEGSADFSPTDLIGTCPAYDNKTQLPAPVALACNDQTIIGSFDVTVKPNGDLQAPSKTLFMDDLTTTGVRVVRNSQLVPSAAITRLRQLMQQR